MLDPCSFALRCAFGAPHLGEDSAGRGEAGREAALRARLRLRGRRLRASFGAACRAGDAATEVGDVGTGQMRLYPC